MFYISLPCSTQTHEAALRSLSEEQIFRWPGYWSHLRPHLSNRHQVDQVRAIVLKRKVGTLVFLAYGPPSIEVAERVTRE